MGCPYPVIDHHLRQATRDFCQRSGAWRFWADPVTADGTVNRFDYDLSPGQEIVRIARALRNNCALAITAGRGLPDDWQDATPDFEQDTLVHFDNLQFMVFPVPEAGDLLTVEMVVKPSQAATGVDDALFAAFVDEISAGAKSRIQMLPKQDWSDVTSAAVNAATFERAIHSAANRDVQRSNSRGLRRTKPVQGVCR